MHQQDNKMEMESPSDLDGAGDRRTQSITESDTPRYIKRKLANGLPIPVYISPESDQWDKERRADANKGLRETPPHPESSIKVLKDFLCCPICSDPCIETTTTNCGHKFCRQCIDQWRKQKPICPICSTLITSQHRLYSDDQFVESQLIFLRPDVKRRFENAQKKRLQILLEERKSRSVTKLVRRKLDNYLTFLRCKNSMDFSKKIYSTSQTYIAGKFSKWSDKFNPNILLGIIIGALFVLCASYITDNTQFLHYIWLAAKNYDGQIPEQWLGTQKEPPVIMTPFQDIINGFNFWHLWMRR